MSNLAFVEIFAAPGKIARLFEAPKMRDFLCEEYR